MKSFEHWSAEDLELTFGLQEMDTLPMMEDWLNAKFKPSQEEMNTLNSLQFILRKYVDSWNEDEVKFFFISPFVVLVNFMGENYRSFTQRTLNVKIKDISGNEVELSGKVDLMVATGKENPRQPFFFIHEYKQEKRRETDPKGQLLSTMVAARDRNETKFPILGSYVIGRLWFFVVLDGNKYCRSLAFDSSREALFDIYAMLKFAKENIQKNALVVGKPTLSRNK